MKTRLVQTRFMLHKMKLEYWNITECSGRGSSKYDRSLHPNAEPHDADTRVPVDEHVAVHGSETIVNYTHRS